MFKDGKGFDDLLSHFNIGPEKVAAIADEAINEQFVDVSKRRNIHAVTGLLTRGRLRPRCRVYNIGGNSRFEFIEEWDIGQLFIPVHAAAIIKMANMFMKESISRESLIKVGEMSINAAIDYNERVYCVEEVSAHYGITVMPTSDGIRLIQVRYSETYPITIEPIRGAPMLSLTELLRDGLSQATALPAGAPAPAPHGGG